MTECQAFIAAGTARQSQRFVIGAGESVDVAQASGEWIATETPVEVEI